MADVLVDSNVLLDVINDDPVWFHRSSEALRRSAAGHTLYINQMIYAEVSVRFDNIEELEAALPQTLVVRRPIPWEAAFLAAKCHLRYRKAGGSRTSTLPDFFIGAHAAVENMILLTRDEGRYRTYFPSIRLLTP